METATDSNAKRSASRKRTYLGIAVALVVVVGAAGVAISASGGQDKSQRSGATLTGKKGSAVTFQNNSSVEISITETRSGTTQILHSCVGPRVYVTGSGHQIPADKAWNHQSGYPAVKRRTDPAECSVTFERAVKAQIDDLRFQVSSCYRILVAALDNCGGAHKHFDMTFQSAGVVGPAQRNVVLDGAYVMNGDSTNSKSFDNFWWEEPDDFLHLGFQLDYNGQRASNGKYTYSLSFKDFKNYFNDF